MCAAMPMLRMRSSASGNGDEEEDEEDEEEEEANMRRDGGPLRCNSKGDTHRMVRAADDDDEEEDESSEEEESLCARALPSVASGGRRKANSLSRQLQFARVSRVSCWS